MTYRVEGGLILFDGPAGVAAVAYDDRSEIVAREVWAHDCYRLGDLTGVTVVDIGANIGVTTLAAIAYGAARVIAVEPDAINLDLLRRNVERLDRDHYADDIASRIEIHHAAVGRPGRVQVHRPPGHARGCCGSSWTTAPEPGAATVAQRPLEDFLDGTDLMVKIDVEGGEYDILAGVGIDVLAARAARLVLEWHHFPARGVDAVEQLPHLVGRLLRRYDLEITGPPHLGGLLFATRR